jgi:hypothetical protein
MNFSVPTTTIKTSQDMSKGKLVDQIDLLTRLIQIFENLFSQN